MSNDTNNLLRALRNMPSPAPRPGFVERALARATGVAEHVEQPRFLALRRVATRWETWFGAALGALAATAVTVLLIRPVEQTSPVGGGIALTLNETREIDVLIESERDLENATIRIAVIGGIKLTGFEDQHQIDWQANLERGTNVLSLPIVAHDTGTGRVIAVIEHEGRTRTLTIDLIVKSADVSRS